MNNIRLLTRKPLEIPIQHLAVKSPVGQVDLILAFTVIINAHIADLRVHFLESQIFKVRSNNDERVG